MTTRETPPANSEASQPAAPADNFRMTTTTPVAPFDQPAAPDPAADLAYLLQLLAVLIAKGESVRDVVDFCRRRVETASGAVGPSANAPTKTHALMTTKEACDLLRCARSTLYAMYHRRELKKTKIGGQTRWARRELDRYIDRQTKGAR